MKNISINALDSKAIKQTIEEIKKYQKEMDNKCKTLRERLAEIGVNVATTGYSGIDYVGDNDITVSYDNKTDTARVIAKGQSVAFIEFGAGITYGNGYPSDTDVDIPIGAGTYPNGKGRTINGVYQPNWSNPKGWWTPKGEHTYGNKPAMAMYKARNEMIAQITQIAKEVFND